MSEVIKTVSRALRLLRVIDPNESPEAEQVTGAIDALNDMMQRWEANGLALGWSAVEAPTDVLPVPLEAEEAVAFNLAIVLRPEYGVAIDPDVYQRAEDGLNALRRDVLVANPLQMRSRLQRTCRYNMITDEYESI